MSHMYRTRYSAFPLLLLIFLLGSPHYAEAQRRFPPNDSAGVPGVVPNSYVISWSSLPNAIGYSYVVSDNPLCFSGCSGDTREAFVRDTNAVEFNLQINHRYYWIIQARYAENDSSGWSLIYSFTTSETDFTRRMISPAPNPIEEQVIRLRIDWAQNPKAQSVFLTLISPTGQQIREENFPEQRNSIRYGEIAWPAQDLSPGRYIIRADITERDQPITDTYWLSVWVP